MHDLPSCAAFRALLFPLLDDELEPSAAALMTEHAGRCRACDRRRRIEANLLEALRSRLKRRPAPPALRARLLREWRAAGASGPATLEGEFLCVRCEHNRRHPGFRSCTEAGHLYAVRAPDGSLWFILPGAHLDSLLPTGSPEGRRVRIEGFADPASHAFELEAVSF